MSYTHAAASDVESVMDPDYGGMWFLRDALATDELGVTILELEPGARGKEHDHADDGQEEVYVCVRGVVDVDFDGGGDDGGETVSLATNEAVRVSADQTRQLQNRGDEAAKLVLVGTAVE
ncbi:cupin domain-containing protein [Halorubellus sp. JP-L1]|uniref:cupin domain-containing protein n=1 Tax=Halorubellus sp. JP-L1 TaxID=2715753 RepID=UPI001408B9E7|nr:cupin domain-containing protein [Halorubellus sp. JP-L1]NHN41008.1 cupin domain-containing protein [Halorubellus sp. JP-L1]